MSFLITETVWGKGKKYFEFMKKTTNFICIPERTKLKMLAVKVVAAAGTPWNSCSLYT